MLKLSLVLGIVVVLGSLLLPAIRRGDAREAAYRTHCRGNLKAVALALHNYHDLWGSFPPACTVAADGQPLHSWRTLILPYLDQKPLYDSIDLEKPWNDPANATALESSLDVYCCPSTDLPINQTTYLAVTASNGCFAGNVPRQLSEITDDHGATLMVIEVPVDQAVPWMSPQDDDGLFVLRFEPDSRLAHTGGTQAVFVDGSVHFLSAELSESQRHALITIAGDDDDAID